MIRSVAFAFALLGTLAVAGVAVESKLPKNIVRSFDKISANTKLKEKAPDYFYEETARVSPDGKYVARLVVGMGEVAYVTVYRRAGKKNIWSKRYAVSQTLSSVSSCIWVRHQKHRFVISTDCAYGVASIALWTNPGKIRFLRRTDKAEGYDVYGTSPDGRTLYYEHFGEGTSDPNGNRSLIQTLTLPK